MNNLSQEENIKLQSEIARRVVALFKWGDACNIYGNPIAVNEMLKAICLKNDIPVELPVGQKEFESQASISSPVVNLCADEAGRIGSGAEGGKLQHPAGERPEWVKKFEDKDVEAKVNKQTEVNALRIRDISVQLMQFLNNARDIISESTMVDLLGFKCKITFVKKETTIPRRDL
jgi:hypothetical protein